LYFGAVLAASLILRVLMCGLRAVDVSVRQRTSFVRAFAKSFSGVGNADPNDDDYWHPFIIGTLELLVFPYLMLTENWNYIGAWLALKTVSQWKSWTERRHVFNRFLIGNLLVIGISYAWLLGLLR
jgi:hypothetical protein